MRKFTINEKCNGEMAIRSMSKIAQDYYNMTDPIIVWEYLNSEQEIKYAINDCGNYRDNLTLHECENYLEEGTSGW